MLILSWNLRWNDGAGPADVATAIAAHRPDLVVLQETTAATDALLTMAGGYYHRTPMPQRRHGPAAWSPLPFEPWALTLPAATRLDLPVPTMRVLVPRLALLIRTAGLLVANVHLDHGQRANRRALRYVLAEASPDVIVGDFNALGETGLPGFKDVGPRRTTHMAHGVMPLRLDRCLVRRLLCRSVAALPYGPSDHRPILLDLVAATDDRAQ